jgi:hypothetical protein
MSCDGGEFRELWPEATESVIVAQQTPPEQQLDRQPTWKNKHENRRERSGQRRKQEGSRVNGTY